ncbi:uncharacterized protein N7498_007929 [Penicillium cinerascens]|uniref:Uncharacterized protein n=1 Tax=Penicillium cinerascens TaxID=70096 RepID=A0A9W9JLV1_9EURO|nr:uncharacterized protein N7498_007929 [Penicillium cinerascens]KAJ5198812.1 hypothetical protein N7498_007929 [Penicillium cinerascens]
MPVMSQPQALESPSGVALTWIFDHCLRYTGSYEIPLRTMYTLNCNPAKNPNRGPETAFTPRSSTSTKASDDSIDAAADFRSQLIHQISRLPSQPCSLPPSFLTSFLRRCFTAELESVDFPQALTALDYLKDLEGRWKKEMNGALQRLGISRDDAENPYTSELALKYPAVLPWLQSINAQARKLEAQYTQIYIGLRRWTLINDMMLEPNNKVNHIAMLNTLFPPVTNATVAPTRQLPPRILQAQRDGFFRYINAVEAKGIAILQPVMSQGAPGGQETSWPLVYDSLDKYLVMANEVIDECALVNEPAHLEESSSPHRSKRGKVDSGDPEKPLPQFPVPKKANGSALERLVTEIRRLGPIAKSKNLRKMKSTTTLGARPGSQHSYAESSFFEIDEKKRRRLIGEATSRKSPQMPAPNFHAQ